MKRKLGYRSNLRVLLAQQGMFATTALAPLRRAGGPWWQRSAQRPAVDQEVLAGRNSRKSTTRSSLRTVRSKGRTSRRLSSR